MNIDFNFIAELEGFETKAYVPDPRKSKSGVTIASGFDLGHRTKSELRSMLDDDLAEKLTPYIGMTKIKAWEFLQENPLAITEEEAKRINKASHKQAANRLAQAWNECAYCEFSDLPINKATVVASVAFQYGSLERKTPNFWRQVTQNDWRSALNNLRNFGDKYPTRRNKEADLLEGEV